MFRKEPFELIIVLCLIINSIAELTPYKWQKPGRESGHPSRSRDWLSPYTATSYIYEYIHPKQHFMRNPLIHIESVATHIQSIAQ